MTSLTHRRSWKALAAHYRAIKPLHLRELFENDSRRGQRLSVEAAGLFHLRPGGSRQ